jgi:hypothetical protein
MSILVLTSDTLIGTPATGNIEYNGQFFGTDSNASRAQLQRITQGTAVASTSGTSIDFTGLPAWVKRLTVMFNGVSGSGTSSIQIQIGAGSVLTSGYNAGVGLINNTSFTTTSNISSGFAIVPTGVSTNSYIYYGQMMLSSMGSNTWAVSGNFIYPPALNIMMVSGAVALSGTLDRVRITTVNGTDTFDAGSINIMYEG